MSQESPTVECVVCGEVVDVAICSVDADGSSTCCDCLAAGRGVEGEVWAAPLSDWSVPFGGRS